MKQIFVTFLAALTTLTMISCSSDDNKNDATQNNELVGIWKVNTIEFKTFVESGIPANDGCMIQGIYGYNFKENKSFTFITDPNNPYDTESKKYWEWTGDEKNFEIIQINPSYPPYNFGFKPTNIEYKNESGKKSLTFTAKLSNGSEAIFKLDKESPTNVAPKITLPDGSPFICSMNNDGKITKKDLENNTWILEKGQEVYKGTMQSTPTQADRAKSILLLSLLDNGNSFLKYTYPMGIISAKNDTWTFDEEAQTFSTHYKVDSFGGNNLSYTIHVNRIDNTKMEFIFKDEVGTEEKRIFIKYETFLNTAEAVDGINDLLNEILTEGTSPQP